MTEERFEQVIENAIEGAADKFDHSMNRAWKDRKSTRLNSSHM